MRWWIALAAAVAVTAALYTVGAGYPFIYVARRIVLHLIGGY
jgi:hypothetical protein